MYRVNLCIYASKTKIQNAIYRLCIVYAPRGGGGGGGVQKISKHFLIVIFEKDNCGILNKTIGTTRTAYY